MKVYHGRIYWKIKTYRNRLFRFCNIRVISVFIILVITQLTLTPIYLSIYLYALTSHLFAVVSYINTETKLEVKCNDQFKVFNNVFVEFLYNITYRRAYTNSFSMVYTVLKFFKNSNTRQSNNGKKLTRYLFLIIFLVFIMLVKSTLGISYRILQKSFSYSLAFGYEKYSLFDSYIWRGRIVNNYQIHELSPVLFYRIYKTNESLWNFNPNYSKKINVLTAKIMSDGYMEHLNYEIREQVVTTHAYVNNSHRPHLTSYISGLNKNNKEYFMGNNLTSNINYNTGSLYYGTPAVKNPQNITKMRIWSMDDMELARDHKVSGFQCVVKKHELLEWCIASDIVFNNDGKNILNFEPIYDNLVQKEFIFNNELEVLIKEAGSYGAGLKFFLTEHQFTEFEFIESWKLVTILLFPEFINSIENFEYSKIITEKSDFS